MNRVVVALTVALVVAVAGLTVLAVSADDDDATGASVQEILLDPGALEGRAVRVRGEVTTVGTRGLALTSAATPDALLVVPIAGTIEGIRTGDAVEVVGIVRPYREGSGILPPPDSALGREVSDDAAVLATEIERD